jgi:hypothetical protein
MDQPASMPEAGPESGSGNPGPSGYQSLEVFVPPRVMPVMIDRVEVGEIPVADNLP